MESEPVRFFSHDLEPAMDRARAALGAFFPARLPSATASETRAATFLRTPVARISLKRSLSLVAAAIHSSFVGVSSTVPGPS